MTRKEEKVSNKSALQINGLSLTKDSVIEVSEEGTEAAAATVAIIGLR